MSYVEIPLIEYIEIHEEECNVYVHTKDKRIILLNDVQTNMTIYQGMVSVDHMQMERCVTFVMPAEDFSHIDYFYNQRNDNDAR
jgi:hypothetical protein